MPPQRDASQEHTTQTAVRPKGSLAPRQWLALVCLSLAAFVFTTSEFLPVGLLTSIARSFGMADTDASVMVSAYAWSVTTLSLPLMVLASRFPFKSLLAGLLVIFAAGQFLAAAAPTFPVLVCARLVVSAAHAIFWSIIAVTATRVVPPERSSTAVGMVTGGTSIANVVGMPLGRAVGMVLGWRAAFLSVGVAALLSLALLALALPRIPAGGRFSVARVPGLVHNHALMALYVVATLMSCAYYTGYGLIEPFLSQVAGMSDAAVTAILMEFGLAALVGVVVFAHAYAPRRTVFLMVTISVQVLVLLGMGPLSQVGTPSLTGGGMWVDVALWGMAEACYGTAFQALLIELCPPDDAAVAMSVYSGLFNLGIGSGTALGAIVARTVGLSGIGLVGGTVGAAGLAVALRRLLPSPGGVGERPQRENK